MSGDGVFLRRYETADADAWDDLVRRSKNGTFLHERGYMDYHADRFRDASLMAFGQGSDKPLALLPACRVVQDDDEWLSSHAGLTYGGWVTDTRMTTVGMLDIFRATQGWLRAHDLRGLIYKVIPRVFHSSNADEDLYAAYRVGAVVAHVEAGSAIDIQAPIRWGKGKLHGLAKARRAEVTVAETDDFGALVTLLQEVLARHNAVPTHTVAELGLLHDRFPNHIRLFVARSPAHPRPIAAVLAFDCGFAAHTQYMASDANGRNVGALETIIDHLIRGPFAERRYLNLGISTTERGRVLNEGLIMQKEMMGARSVAHITLRIPAMAT